MAEPKHWEICPPFSRVHYFSGEDELPVLLRTMRRWLKEHQDDAFLDTVHIERQEGIGWVGTVIYSPC